MSTFDGSKPLKKNNYDTEAPPNLIQFMVSQWRVPKPVTGKIRNIGNFRKRREALSKLFPGEMLVIPTGHFKVRSNDTHYAFRPASDFFYLTGNLEPDCVLVLVPEGDDSHRPVLFVEPNNGKTDETFFTDRVKGELWEGARLGVAGSKVRYDIDDCRGLPELTVFLRQTLTHSTRGYRVLRGFSAATEAMLVQPNDHAQDHAQAQRDAVMATALSEMRLYKDKEELRELSAAIASTKRGFEDVIKRLKTAKTERELEGVFFTRARMEGNDVGYGSIVASGAHACTLHWKKNDGKIKKGDLLLLDAGVEGNALYTADITRTLPISGKFSKAQREIYELVLCAQAAAFKQVKPGNDFMDPNRAAMKVLAQGLADLGILQVSAEAALREENQFYRRYSLHNVSHMLGLDVHDCAKARAENYKYGKLVPGMVLTVEPGLYFQPDDLTVPAKYRGIGIRIEDDVVVTAKGLKILSQGIPREVAAVEKWMKTCWKARK